MPGGKIANCQSAWPVCLDFGYSNCWICEKLEIIFHKRRLLVENFVKEHQVITKNCSFCFGTCYGCVLFAVGVHVN